MTTQGQSVRPRSLADDLRLRSDEGLAALLAGRPDLLHPVPADVGQLAARAATPSSVSAALDGLNHLELSVCQALAALPDPVDEQALHAGLEHAVGYTPDAVSTAVARLRELALIWGDELHLVRAAREAFGPYPCGLAQSFADSRRAVRQYGEEPRIVLDLLETAPKQVAEIVAQLAWNPTGTLRNAQRPVDATKAKSPLEWLLAHDLIVATSDTTVVMPREVALAVRRGALLTDLTATPAPIVVRNADCTHVDGGGAQAAIELLRLVDTLLEAWSYEPPSALRGGGLSVRDLAAAATTLRGPLDFAALIVELCHAARLISVDADGDIVPTTTYDRWSAADDAQRWATLAAAWRDMPRAPHVCTDEGSDKPNPLTAGVERPYIAGLRQTAVHLLAVHEPGAATTPAAVIAHLEWQRPRRASQARNRSIEAVLREAEWLGVMCGGALTSFGRALFENADPRPALSAHIAATVDHIIVQADLTALAPGRLPTQVARTMATLADIESTGGATTYRFTEASLRRGFDQGMAGFEIEEFLASLSRTPLPQPLTYLIGDVARSHGSVRVGIASVYLRCDDEQLVAQMSADRKLASLGLRKLAPGILVSASPPDIVLERLRGAGYAPVAESTDGSVMVHRPDARRTSSRATSSTPVPTSVSPRLAAAAVRALRAGEQAASVSAVGGAPRTSTLETMAVVREALDRGVPLWIGYADRGGSTTERVIEPMTLSGGFLTAFDLRSSEVRTFTVARITGAQLTDSEDTP